MSKASFFIGLFSLIFVVINAKPQPDTDTQVRKFQLSSHINLPIIIGRSKTDRFILGTKDSTSKPLYSNSNTLIYNSTQDEVSVSLEIPPQGQNIDGNITQITVEMEGSTDVDTQVHLTSGEIGSAAVEIELIAKTTDFLRYSVIVYGKKI